MIRFGTCSWKYNSWYGIIYPDSLENYLSEYAKSYSTVEIDQWFWSLFPKKVLLPDRKIAEEYHESVPEDFRFTIKVPNSLTLTHYYNKTKSASLIKNPLFLSTDLFEEFLLSIAPIKEQVGMLMFQFEYLSKEKMSSLSELQSKFQEFSSDLPEGTPPIGIEIRNPNYLTQSYFKFLNQVNVSHVFLEGYFMPAITNIYKKYQDHIKGTTVIRLHGPDRSGIEELSGEKWNQIYINRDKDLEGIRDMLINLHSRDVNIYININNHYEGCAPLTIKKFNSLIDLSK